MYKLKNTSATITLFGVHYLEKKNCKLLLFPLAIYHTILLMAIFLYDCRIEWIRIDRHR